MLNAFLSARFFTLLDSDEDPIPEATEAVTDVEEGLGALNDLSAAILRTFGSVSASSERIVYDWRANGEDGLLVMEGVGLGPQFGSGGASIGGFVTDLALSLGSNALLSMEVTDTAIDLLLGDTTIGLDGQFDTSFGAVSQLFDRLLVHGHDTDAVLESLTRLEDFDLQGLSLGLLGQDDLVSIAVTEDRLALNLGEMSIVLEGTFEGDLADILHGDDLAGLFGDGLDPTGFSGAHGLTNLSIADAVGTLFSAEGDFDTAEKLNTLKAVGTAAADKLRLTGTLADEINMEGRLGADILGGAAGNDIIFGQRGADRLWGMLGEDKLYGGFGRDTLHGGQGNDEVRGGPGLDAFIFGKGHGKDRIIDFKDDFDTLVLNPNLWRASHGTLSVEEVVETFARTGLAGNVQLRFDADTKVIFYGISEAEALLDDISFA